MNQLDRESNLAKEGMRDLNKKVEEEKKKKTRKWIATFVVQHIMTIAMVFSTVIIALIIIAAIGDILDLFTGGGNTAYAEEYSDVTYDGTLVGDTPEEKTWNFLIANGATEVGAAAMMGNIYRESKFDPKSEYPTTKAFGICQWYKGRRTNLQNYAQSKGTTEDDFQTQLEFLLKELFEISTYKKTKDIVFGATDASKLYACNSTGKCTCCLPILIRDNFEVPGYGHSYDAQCVKERKEWAKKYYEMFKGKGANSAEEEVTGNQGGTYTDLYPNRKPSVHVGIKGAFQSAITNQKFYVYYQGAPGWGTWCNRAAAICLWSGYNANNNNDAISLFDYADKAGSDINKDSEYSKHGLKRSSIGTGKYSQFKSDLRTALLNGKYGLFYITDSHYTGKSGTQWSHTAHWLVALGYQKVNGAEQIFIADAGKLARGGWTNINEFDTANVRFYTVSKNN